MQAKTTELGFENEFMIENIKFLPLATDDQKAFILDHGKTEEDGQLKYADDLTSYGWNVKQYGKLKAGAFVLNRHPGKITKDRKFEIYAGGYVESVSKPDEDGNVTAVISHAFKIEPPIRQGDQFIENFEWDTPSKKERKKPNSWGNVWDQYGMNEITYVDFKALIEGQHIVPLDAECAILSEPDLTDSELAELEENGSNGFTVIVDEVGPSRPTVPQKCKFVGRNTNWNDVNKSKQKTGALGEQIVLDLLSQEAKKNGLTRPVHVSKEEGDGFGYDIRSWDKDANEIHIEVKASKSKYSDGFEMSANEVEASKGEAPYKIYFVHDLDVKLKQCKIKIYDGPFMDGPYKLVPTTYKVYNNQ